MANCHDAIGAWEWDSVFALTEPSTSSLLEHDTNIGSWHGYPAESSRPIHALVGADDTSLSAGQPKISELLDPISKLKLGASSGSALRDDKRTTPGSSPGLGEENRQTTDTSNDIASERSPGNSSDVSEKRKRDPRLDCPNFLAGRIPCSCPEDDELEDDENEETNRKRPKSAARCQVPTCRAAIGHLKGYHQRHKVCLACANSPKVILNGQGQRYCQQCGKFHRLLDFDEGKRSCRRKLERHNTRRRRRKPLEAGGEAQGKEASVFTSEKENHSAGSPGDAIATHGEARPNSPISGEQRAAVQDVLVYPNAEASQSCQEGAVRIEQAPYHFEGAETRASSPIAAAPISVMREVAHSSGGREGPEIHSGRFQPHTEAPCQLSLQFPPSSSRGGKYPIPGDTSENRAFTTGSSAKEFQNATMEEIRASDSSSAVPLHLGQEIFSSNKSGLDEQSWLALLMDDATEGDGLPCSPRFTRQLHSSEPELPRSSLSSSGNKKHTAYMSPCPSGRVSFKLYDWNPADFPRRLRQQIFEWLSNMPVELEGYIRSGCTILTFFITMPESMWDKLNDDWVGYVKNIIFGPEHGFWGTGRIIARLNNTSVHVKNGKILSADFKEELAPILLDVYPLSLEVGCATDMFIYGINLFRTKSRFLVSFGGQYLECDGCEPVGYRETGYISQRAAGINADNLEVCKIIVRSPDNAKLGPAYVEVDHDLGVSNVIPVLIADKEVCAEVNSLRHNNVEAAAIFHDGQGGLVKPCEADSMSRQRVADLLVDLGWVLRYMEEHNSINRAEVGDALMTRLQRLLLFSVRHRWSAVAKRLLQTAMATGLITETGAGPSNLRMAHFNIIKDFINLKKILSNGDGSSFECSLHEIKALQINLLPSEVKASKAENGYASKLHKQCQDLLETKSEADSDTLERSYLPSTDSQVPHSGDDVSPLINNEERYMKIPLLEKRVTIMDDDLQQGKSPMAQRFGWLKRSMTKRGSIRLYATNDRKMCRIVLTAVSVVMVCAGMCLGLQRSHQVAEISMSLRRCLWGSTENAV